MKINLLILLALVLLGGGMTYVTQNNLRPSENTPQNAQHQDILELLAQASFEAPDFEYQDINGRAGALSSHRGKIVLLHFWASWCAPCLVEFPDLVGLAKETGQELIILAVSTDNDKSDIEKFLNKTKVRLPENFIIIHDENKEITQDLYQTLKLPESYLIGTNGYLLQKIIGPQENWNTDVWKNKIELIYNEKQP